MPPLEESSAAGQQAPTAPGLNFTSNFPIPSPMKVSGDRVTNWEFFRQQCEDYEVGTDLEYRPQPVRLATLHSVMGKDCLEIFLNLEVTPDERASVTDSLKALEAYFKPKNKCGLREISVQFSYRKFRRGDRRICKSTGKDGFVMQIWRAHGRDDSGQNCNRSPK